MGHRYSSSPFSKHLIFFGLIATLFCLTGLAGAHTTHIVFVVNGDTSATSMVQGDSLAWGADCAVGANLTWEIWYDVNGNNAINVGTDVLVNEYTTYDGDVIGNNGLPDSEPTPDGIYLTPYLMAGIADVKYVFRVTDLSDNSIATKSITVSPMVSPPNSFSGTLVVPGHPAPDAAVLGNHWVQAEIESESQIWSDFSNDSGKFTINIANAGTGLSYRIQPPDLPGYITPDHVTMAANGHRTLANFVYVTPSDSVFGTVKDDSGNDINGLNIYANPQFGGNHRETQSSAGAYTLYFSSSERGVWWIGVSKEGLVPQYMVPFSQAIDNTSDPSIQHDIVCLTADTTVYVRITENGAPAAHPYHIQVTQLETGDFTEGYTASGAGNIIPLHVSSTFDTGWYAMIIPWDTLYPIPPDLVSDGSENHMFDLGDTLTINLVSGYKVSDTIKVDAGDPLPHWDSVWVGLCDFDGCRTANFDSSGVYTIYADTGDYVLGTFAPGYLTTPNSYDLQLLHDTVGGLSFTLNRTHCRITGTLTNVPLPLTGPTWVIGLEESGSGLTTSAEVDPMTGTFELFLCDGDWSIAPPSIPNRIAPPGGFFTIGEAPDTMHVQNFAYSIASGVDDNPSGDLPKKFALNQNYPNPFNPSTLISFDLPSPSSVNLEVYNLLGQSVATLVHEEMRAGTHTVLWNAHDATGRELSSGIYFYKLIAGNFVETKKMVYLK